MSRFLRTTWQKSLEAAQREAGEPDAQVVARAPDDDAVWQREFNDGYGLPEGEPVLAWTEQRVYFPVCYDGSEWLDSAPRNPPAEAQAHVGGW